MIATEQTTKQWIPSRASIPKKIAEHPQWVAWRAIRKREGKLDKVPVNPLTGAHASVSDPNTWSTIDEALRYAKNHGLAGIGYVFTANDGLFGVDLDNCIDEAGHVAMWAWEIVESLGTYAEISPSGRGIKIIGEGILPGKSGESRSTGHRVEVYDSGRFFTITADVLRGAPTEISRSEALPQFYAALFPNSTKVSATARSKTAFSFTEDVTAAARALDQLAQWRCDEYQSWLEVGMSLTPLGDVGLSLWDKWSQDSAKYQPGKCAEKWGTFTRSDGVTLGSLLKWAQEDRATSKVIPLPVKPPPLSGDATDESDLGTGITLQFVLDCFAEQEFGDARLFARLFDGKVVHDHALKAWFLFGPHHWGQDTTGAVKKLVAGAVANTYLKAAAKIMANAADEEDEGRRKDRLALADAVVQRARRLQTHGRVQNVLAFAATLLGVPGDKWDSNPDLLAVANGVLELRTATLRPGRPDDYLRTAAPTEWRGIDEPAPRWEQFLREVLEQDNAQDTEALCGFAQRLLGYGITGHTSEHKVPIFHGKGRNGKDTLLETALSVLGPIAAPVNADVLVARKDRTGAAEPYVYDLWGKRLVWASELNEGAALNAAQVKLITGGGSIKTRPLYGNPVEFKPTHTVILITNAKPRAPADDYALWKRILLISFNRQFVDKPSPNSTTERRADRNLRTALLAEAAGILAWLARGAKAWYEKGLQPPEMVLRATEDYQREEDVIAQFIDECCVVNQPCETRSSVLYRAYLKWATSTGQRPMSATALGKKMAARFQKVKREYGLAYLGIGLLAHNVDDEDPA